VFFLNTIFPPTFSHQHFCKKSFGQPLPNQTLPNPLMFWGKMWLGKCFRENLILPILGKLVYENLKALLQHPFE